MSKNRKPIPAEPSPVSVEDTIQFLGLVLEHPPSPEVVATWTDEDRRLAVEWAGREHLAASDNDVERLPRPEALARFYHGAPATAAGDPVMTAPVADTTTTNDTSSPEEEEELRALEERLLARGDSNPEIARRESWRVTVTGDPLLWHGMCSELDLTPLYIEDADYSLHLIAILPTDPVVTGFLGVVEEQGFKVVKVQHLVSALREGERALFYAAHVVLDGPFRVDRPGASRDLYRPGRWYRSRREAKSFDSLAFLELATSQSKPSKVAGFDYVVCISEKV